MFCAVVATTAQNICNPLSRINILFAGDLMQHQSQLNAAQAGDGLYSYSPCYNHIREEVGRADIAIANLETTIGSRRFGGYPSFCAPDSFLYAAKGAGFDVLLFANNHCLDRGKQGALRTMQMMDSLGVVHCGVYRDSTDRKSRYPLIIEKKGARIALLNYTYGTNGIPVPPPLVVNFIDKEQIKKDIARAKEMKPDAIIACMHWGDEYVSTPPKYIKELAAWLLEEGVDHIVGNHPHVVQPIEMRSDSLTAKRNAVIYSTGNLVSGMYARGRDGGLLVRLGLLKIYDICWLSSLEYALTWVARPERDGYGNFTILPADTSLVKSPTGKSKMQEFIYDTRRLFNQHNRGDVKEFFLK
ncbi:MAG: CapA family protein [Bacteroidaceae bacterium]|nr:CapA family protein [Bacteroidaceae bacterium]